MASLIAGITALSLTGVPGLETWDDGTPLPVAASDTASITATEGTPTVLGIDPQIWTELGLTGVPFPVRDSFDAVAPSDQLDLEVSDTASISGTEDPVDGQEIETSDIAQITLSEVVQLFNNIDLTDSANLTLSETINLQTSGTPDVPVTETASLTLTEVATLDVELTVTDDAALTLTESPTVDVSGETFDVTDTTSLSLSETVLLDIFAGVVEINADDIASLGVTEVAALLQITPAEIARISMSMKAPRIVIRQK
jgi:hypothetical protein